MNILLSCLQSPVSYPIPPYRFWEEYFKRGIEEAGHTWTEVPGADWAFPLAAMDAESLTEWKQKTWSRVLDHVRESIRRGRIDLFLSYQFPEMVDPAAVLEIRSMGIPCVNFFCDNLRTFNKVPKSFACFDLHWVPELLALPLYKAAKLKALHLPMPCWVPQKHRTPPADEIPRVLFAGSSDVLRQQLLNDAIRLGAKIKVAGSGWNAGGNASASSESKPARTLLQLFRNQVSFANRHGLAGLLRKLARGAHPPRSPSIPNECITGALDSAQYANAIRDSMITLGINRVDTFRRSFANPLAYSRLRDIEAPMLGACYLTEWTNDLEVFYEIGREIEVYRDASELTDKIAFLGAAPARRKELRVNGQIKALREHSVARSIAKIAKELSLPK